MMEKQTLTVVPMWAIPAMDSFISTVNKKKDAGLFRQNIRRLALALDEEGTKGWTEITPGQIWKFFRGRPFWQFRGIERFLNFIGLNMLSPFANERNGKRILDASAMKLPDATVEECFDVETVKSISFAILQEMEKAGYSKTCLTTSRRIYLDLSNFLYANGLSYTKSICDRWFNEMKLKREKSYIYWNHSICVLEAVISGMPTVDAVADLSFKTRSNMDVIPDWAEPSFLEYKARRKKDGIGASALTMDYSSIRRFTQFLDSKGIRRFEDLTVSIVKEYHASDDTHRTVEGKNAYAIRIRRFLSYLEAEGIVAQNIPLALSRSKCRKTRPVTVLTREQMQTVEEYIHNATSPNEIRNSLIVGMGLYLGLRGCDIVNAKISDIDWNRQELSVTQQKTKRYIKLPMPMFLCNLAYRYISEVRPDKWHVNNILIRTKAPYKAFSKNVCLRALKDILGEDKPLGFHILRRTFASELLRNTVAPDMIAETLGHAGISTVDKYLTTDEKNLRSCMLSLEEV
ncbi:MAG: tyrosine-type recombinase/integrase [Spirochaetales bacterium]|nr:tyrosine-type recombinase/integrase [Spirochaetales bacterium]